MDAATTAVIEKGKRNVEILKQGQYSPLRVEEQAAIIFCGTNGLLMDVPAEKVKEFEVKAPVDGTISKVFFNNSGEVVSKGSTLGELIPKGRPLIFAARLKPEDIMEVSLGQETLITLSNMDTRKDQAILGRIASVEKNSRVDDNFGRYFQVEIAFIDPASNGLIVPGVDGSASILLGKRSVLEYVLEPIFSSLHGALSE